MAPIEEMDDDINRLIIDLNLTSAIMSCRTFTPQFKKQGYGKIINVSSACDRRSWPGWSVYSAAKAGVNAFTKCLYTELRPHGIAVTLLVPGGSNTGFQAAATGVDKFEWDEELAVRPEHFADMVYQTCALDPGRMRFRAARLRTGARRQRLLTPAQPATHCPQEVQRYRNRTPSSSCVVTEPSNQVFTLWCSPKGERRISDEQASVHDVGTAGTHQPRIVGLRRRCYARTASPRCRGACGRSTRF